jgi:hypothetical protein
LITELCLNDHTYIWYSADTDICILPFYLFILFKIKVYLSQAYFASMTYSHHLAPVQGAGGVESVEQQWNTIIINGPQGGSDKPLEQHFPLAGLREATEYQARRPHQAFLDNAIP